MLGLGFFLGLRRMEIVSLRPEHIEPSARQLVAFERKREIISRLAKADPGNAAWQRDVSVWHNKIGDVLVAQGNLPAALDAYKAGLATPRPD